MTEELFLSYSRHDHEFVSMVDEELARHNYKPWIDRKSLLPGDRWRPEIVAAISRCDYFLLFLSKHSIQSVNVIREVGLASEKEKIIIPIRLEAVEIPDVMAFQLEGIQYIDLARTQPVELGPLLRALKEKSLRRRKTEGEPDTEERQVAINKSEPNIHGPRRLFLLAALASIAICGLIVTGTLAYYSANQSRATEIAATQTALATDYPSVALNETAQLPSPTLTASRTPEPIITLTGSTQPTSTSTGPTLVYATFDDFDTAGELDERWDIKDNPVECTSKSKRDGFLVLECHSDPIVKIEYSIGPKRDEDELVAGVMMLAKVDEPLSDFSGKLHLKVSLWNPKDNTSRSYLLSLRGGTVYVSALDGGGESVHVGIAPGAFHLLEVNYEDKRLIFRVDGTVVPYDPQLTPDFEWKEWVLEVSINPVGSGVRILSAEVDWIAIKK